MNKRIVFSILMLALLLLAFQPPLRAQVPAFDFERLQRQIKNYTVVLEIKVELSFGTQSTEQKQRVLGTIVTADGLTLFDGAFLDNESGFATASGITVKTTPTKIEATTLDGKKMLGEFIGVDRFTKLGFVRLNPPNGAKFIPVQFLRNQKFRLGTWFALYMLLPEHVSPPLAADIGMVSTILESPEYFPLTIGLGPAEIGSVLFDERLNAVGVVGVLPDPSSASSEGGFLSSFDGGEFPLLGVITAERLNSMIANPPTRGKIDRAWLGISLQALTPDIAEYLSLEVSNGIIVNDVVSNSPAERAGLRVGDIVYEIDGQKVNVDREERISIFQKRIAEMGSGKQVTFSVLRPDAEHEYESVKVVTTLEKAPLAAADAIEFETDWLEFGVREMVFADYNFNNLDQEQFKGVVVSKLKSGGLAYLGGLQLGDIIQRIGNQTVTSVEDIKAVIQQLETEKPTEVVFFVWRDNKTMFVRVKTV